MRIIRVTSILAVIVIGANLMFQYSVKAQDSKQIGSLNRQPIFEPKDHGARDFAIRHDRHQVAMGLLERESLPEMKLLA